ncbi:MAG TPA: hypothetical protein VMW68_08535 [Methyloceanibacter sp.]|nr:hypothetical protein [Methyloceanibacter sp.]
MIELEKPPIGRRRFVFVEGKPGSNFRGLVEVERQPPRPRVAIRRADNDPIQSMFDGKVYPSVARMRQEARGRGLEEAGDEYRAFAEPELPQCGPTDDELRAAAETIDWSQVK